MHKLMNIPLKYTSDDDLIDLTHESILYNKNCQYQLQPRYAVVVPRYVHQVAPSAVNRRRRWWRGRSPGCSWGGRSGREGGRSEGSSGGPPRRSALSCIPDCTTEKTMSKIHGGHFVRSRKQINNCLERHNWDINYFKWWCRAKQPYHRNGKIWTHLCLTGHLLLSETNQLSINLEKKSHLMSGDDELLHANSPEQSIITTKAVIKVGDLHRMYFVLMSRSGFSQITAAQTHVILVSFL